MILLLTLSSYPVLEALFAAQLGLLVAFLLAASLFVLRRDRFLLAGFLMAITTIKPQVTVLAILYFLTWALYDWRVRGRFVIGFFSTLGLLVGASLVAMPHWIQSWTHTVLAYRHYTRPPLVTEVLTSPLGLRFSGLATFVLTAASIIFAITLAWRNRAAAYGSFAFWITLTLLLAITTITILPGQAVYDHVIFFPGILLLVALPQHPSRRRSRASPSISNRRTHSVLAVDRCFYSARATPLDCVFDVRFHRSFLSAHSHRGIASLRGTRAARLDAANARPRACQFFDRSRSRLSSFARLTGR